jgi:hypothetical protein
MNDAEWDLEIKKFEAFEAEMRDEEKLKSSKIAVKTKSFLNPDKAIEDIFIKNIDYFEIKFIKDIFFENFDWFKIDLKLLTLDDIFEEYKDYFVKYN